MALNAAQTRTEIVAALNGLSIDASEADRWDAVIGVLYTRIKADMVVTSTVATAIPVATTGSAAAQTGATTSTGTATSSSIT